MLKGRVFERRHAGFNLALMGALSLPTGGVLKANGGERLPTFDPRNVIDYLFGQGTLIALNVGVRIRAATTVGNLNVGTELVYGLGVEVPVWRNRAKTATGTLALLAELYGAVGFTDAGADPDVGIDAEEVPLEALGGVRYRFQSGWRLTLAGGAGLTSGYGSPDFRVLLNVAFASTADRDGDGIPDAVDRCPDQAEDFDGLEDMDGCPDQKPRVKITATRLEILEKVLFETKKAVIMKRSFGLLQDVANVLNRNQWVLKVRIEGHTDTVGSARKNWRLSQRRAVSVRRFLIKLGVAANRLEPKGFGEAKPTEKGCDRRKPRAARAACHAANRRVLFMILKTSNAGKPPAATIRNP